jgi:hypothetical protein
MPSPKPLTLGEGTPDLLLPEGLLYLDSNLSFLTYKTGCLCLAQCSGRLEVIRVNEPELWLSISK